MSTKKVWLLLGAVAILVGGGFFVWQKLVEGETPAVPETTKTYAASVPAQSGGNALEFSDDSRFGFLTEPDDTRTLAAIQEIGAGWLRPHPGRFVWNDMQESATADIDFVATDREVQQAQKFNFNLLITLWPLALWDQKSRPDVAQCQVPASEQFAPILTIYRCPPTNWDAYGSWLAAIVERYDGDGENDMPGLIRPVRHWEVLNEPDMADPSLTFFKGSPEDYGVLLKKSYQIIKQTDTNAQILIAGAAGGGKFLDFWEKVLVAANMKDAFDIGNIHSLGRSDDLNVSEYKRVLEKFDIAKPIWVTEAQNTQGDLAQSVGGAFNAGAEKIFFTGAVKEPTGPPRPGSIVKNLDYFQTIIEKYEP